MSGSSPLHDVRDILAKSGATADTIDEHINQLTELINLRAVTALLQARPPREKISTDEFEHYLNQNFTPQELVAELERQAITVTAEYLQSLSAR